MFRTRVAVARCCRSTALMALTGCSAIDRLTSSDDPSASSSASPSATPTPYESQFTRDGTFQSHIDVNGMDFVYTLYPTKSTPRTNEWFPKGPKFFSFTFQAYDLDQKLRDPFATKRKVWLERIQVTSTVKLIGGAPTRGPYSLDAIAKNVTFDPEPLTSEVRHAHHLTEGRLRASQPEDQADRRWTPRASTCTSPRRCGSRSARVDEYYKKTIKQTRPDRDLPEQRADPGESIPVNAN